MTKPTINRRQFLQRSGRGIAGGVAASVVPALVLNVDAWAAELGTLDKSSAEVLLRMCRLLYPHDRLHDGYYATCVEGLDSKAAGDEALAQQLKTGADGLNAAAGGSFTALDEAGQLAALTAIETTPFFQTVRGHMVVALYNQPKVWAELGYEGPSFPFGGYLERGFNDVDWLPDAAN